MQLEHRQVKNARTKVVELSQLENKLFVWPEKEDQSIPTEKAPYHAPDQDPDRAPDRDNDQTPDQTPDQAPDPDPEPAGENNPDGNNKESTRPSVTLSGRPTGKFIYN